MTPSKKLTFSLRATLVTSVIISALFAIGLTVGAIGFPAYQNAKESNRKLWTDLAQQVAQSATDEIVSYFQNAPTTLRLIEGLVEEGALKTSDVETVLDICYRALLANPQFVNVYWAQFDGSLYGVLKIGNDYVGSYRFIQPDGKTAIRSYRIGPGMKWEQTGEETSDYDPRKRPFWTLGVAHPDGVWTEPYSFATTNATGYSYVLGQKGKEGLVGFWTVDFQIDYLSQYLSSLNVGKEGEVYLISEDGNQIAASVSKQGNRQNQIVYTNSFPQESKIPWSLVTVIHEKDFLEPIRENALHSLSIGLVPCALFLIALALLFGKLSRRMRQIAKEMDKVGNLTLEMDKAPSYSRVREINMMTQSLQKMKIGLHSFSKYVPLDLVKKLIQSGHPATLGGEKREVTVLFSDLAQFTTLSELLTPDEIGTILADFFEMSTREVVKEKGTIDKFIGDAVMAIWGAPDFVLNHAMAACRTALAMKKIALTSVRMKHKIGINTGEAMVGNFGSDERMDYTAIGDTVNIAARLEKINKQYHTQILIGPKTAESVRDTLLVRPIDWVTLHGRAHSTLVYELIDDRKQCSEHQIHAVETYQEALAAYQKRNFGQARTLFETANTLFGGSDAPSKILIQRCKHFEVNPPPSNWDSAAPME